ncbi:MAG: hypothetical protein ACMXYD_02170 [Candidatus Woesearchaeota archaeon]
MKAGMRQLAIAEHLLNKSYPALQDPKILLSVLQNLLAAIDEAITQHLQEARKNHEIPPYNNTLNGRLNAARMHLAKKKNITKVDFMMISEIQETLSEHEQAPTEFKKNNALYIANNDFHLTKLDEKKTKTYMSRTRTLLTRL